MENKEENAGADRSIFYLFCVADGQVWGKYGYIDDNSVIRYIIFKFFKLLTYCKMHMII